VKRPGRKLSGEEAALWKRVVQTVQPLKGRVQQPVEPPPAPPAALPPATPPPRKRAKSTPALQPTAAPTPPKAVERRPLGQHGLDAGWDHKLARGLVAPDFTLDLHGATLDAAHGRLEHGLTLALAQGARLVLLITGRDRPSEDRRSRGVIRRKFMDWLAIGPHASRIAAVRPAHPRHGGPGAVYIVLRRPR
jgi:DNA-nicking Smr family endonuclease